MCIIGWLSNKDFVNKQEKMAKATPSEEKKEIILKAVRKLLAQKGYAGTTISLVAKEAGVSRGLLHYYFKNKEDMLARVIHDEMEFCIDGANSVFSVCNSSEELAEAFASGLRSILEDDPDFYPAFFEGWAIAHQSNVVNEKIKDLYGEFRHSTQTGLQGAVDRGIISPSISLYGLASAIIGLVDGIGLQMVADPELINNEEIWTAIKESILSLLNG